MREYEQPNELFDSPAFLAMPEESWPRERASYTADVYAAPPEDEGADSPAAVAVARARALLEEAGNLSTWRHLPDQVQVRTREAVWALCVAVEALEAQGVTLHEPAPDLAQPTQLGNASRDDIAILTDALAEAEQERDQLREARDAFRAELHRALAENTVLQAIIAGEERAA